MTNKLISLVVIMLILLIGHSYSDNQFLFPKEKPSIFKKINKNEGQSFSSSLPKKKPLSDIKIDQKNEVIQKKLEDLKQKEKEKVKKVEVRKQISSFIFPQKKPSVYKSKTETAEKSSILSQKDFAWRKLCPRLQPIVVTNDSFFLLCR